MDNLMNSLTIILVMLIFFIIILAFIYDLNFEYSLKKIRDEKYIEKLIDRIDYKDEQTKKRMEYLKITAIEDINKKINKEEQKWRKKVLDYGL